MFGFTEIERYGDLRRLTNKWYRKRGVAFGDSITVGYLTTNGGYTAYVKQALVLTAYDNFAISGTPMANGTAQNGGVGTNGTIKTKNFATTNYDFVTIASGTNDFKLNVPLGTLGVMGDTTFDTNTFYGAYRDAIEYMLGQSPTMKIILLTPLQRDNSSYDVNYTNTAGAKLIDYVNAIKNIGEMYSLRVIDQYRFSGISKKNLSTLTADGLHPNDVGAIYQGKYVTNELR
ncbi:SGNH/GDSL hydrolase family protein [Clostridium pasteurianum]|uniref:Lysophospholipase L1-like esterase n=1 Tax=Clostridium pasteurianum BC1 TaxID=86416 RepID=R4KB02_CLOPA|nr:SGNH/GDSL hydrolase family protein [Clostridium pasteurianum]AGK96815.1 lysophospholipase L1-like esterase [Clostridium pasteurianum BC1]